ncbi:MAG: T9SS type A sorting domain-containing protein [Fluviicola sp.]|nr:T9SS type A sorting domain-containing protein [Fluviicola sp.]
MKNFKLLLTKTFVLCTFIFTLSNGYSQFTTDFESRSIGIFKSEVVDDTMEDASGFSLEKTATCSNISQGTIPLMDCSDIGTSAYNTNSLLANVDYTPGASPPSPYPGCYSGLETAGNWSVYDLDASVETVSITVDFSSFAEGGGLFNLYMSFYQGTDCSNLTQVACELVLTYDLLLGWIPIDPIITGLDPTQQLWVSTAADDIFLLDVELRGFVAPVNSTCVTAVSTSVGCNAGAVGQTSWTGPSNNGVTCSGGTWYSNENTVFYTFTATAANATLEIQNVVCNDGTNGEAQFAVWDACGNIGDYTTGFLGCAVGAGTLSMPALTIGNSYIIVADGQAGDACTWDFVSTGIALPTELISLEAESLSGYNRVYWTTASEINSDYFIVEKSVDGFEFEAIGTVKSAGNSQSIIDYSFDDYEQRNENVYYRLKQVDFDGKFEYHGPRSLNFLGKDELTITPNPLKNGGVINFPFKAKQSYSMQLIDVSGRILQAEQIYNSIFQSSYVISTASLKKGMYTLRLTDSNGKVSQTRMLKN